MTALPGATPALQLALDGTDLDAAEALVLDIGAPALTRVEVGTPLLIAEGLPAVRRMRSVVPEAVLVADTKICDAGARIAASAFDAGADVVTVVAAAIDEQTWAGVVESAAGWPNRRVLLDAIGWPVDLATLDRWVAAAGESAVAVEICVHRPKTDPGPFDALIDEVRIERPASYAVAGKMTADLVRPALDAGFETIIVGGAIIGDPGPSVRWGRFVDQL
jgi:3-hexulose-6-phosphate synthase